MLFWESSQCGALPYTFKRGVSRETILPKDAASPESGFVPAGSEKKIAFTKTDVGTKSQPQRGLGEYVACLKSSSHLSWYELLTPFIVRGEEDPEPRLPHSFP